MEPEFFIEIKDFPDYYISTYGRVFSRKKNREKFLKLTKSKEGYIRVKLANKKDVKSFRVHRLVATHFIKNYDNKPEVDHINRIRYDNKVENLRWVNRLENSYNKCAKGYYYNEKENCWYGDILYGRGKRKRKFYYVSKYGYEEAKQKAILWRNEMKRKYYKID